jgi:hypothetical protein
MEPEHLVDGQAFLAAVALFRQLGSDERESFLLENELPPLFVQLVERLDQHLQEHPRSPLHWNPSHPAVAFFLNGFLTHALLDLTTMVPAPEYHPRPSLN